MHKSDCMRRAVAEVGRNSNSVARNNVNGHFNDATRLAHTFTPKEFKRFWSKVNKDGPTPKHDASLGKCWEWTGKTQNNGYGRFRIGKYTSKSHRVSYRVHIGDIDSKMSVLHKCDNRKCINPSHLYQGDGLQNMADAIERNRLFHPTGIKNVNAKIR